MALAYHEGHPEELEALSREDLRRRLYKVVKFAETGQMTLRYHAEARSATVLGADLFDQGFHRAGESRLNFEEPFRLLLISPVVYFSQMLFEGIHFRMALDGTISFFERKGLS